MKIRTSEWFEVKFLYEQLQGNGLLKKVTELYVVDALSFTEAEKKICEEMESYASGDIFVKSITRAPYKGIFFEEDEKGDKGDKWYKAKLEFITIDERSEKEKKSIITYLVQAENIDNAKKNVTNVMAQTMIDYVFQSIAETKIIDVFEHKFTEK